VGELNTGYTKKRRVSRRKRQPLVATQEQIDQDAPRSQRSLAEKNAGIMNPRIKINIRKKLLEQEIWDEVPPITTNLQAFEEDRRR